MGSLTLKRFTQYALVVAAIYLGVRYWPNIVSVAAVVWEAASPLVMGCVMAYVLNIPMVALEKFYFPHSTNPLVQKSKRLVCILLSFVIMIIIAILLVVIVFPEVRSSVELIVKEVPAVWESIRAWIVANAEYLPMLQDTLQQSNFNWTATFQRIMNALAAGAGGMLGSVVNVATSVFGTMVKLGIGFIFALYVLFNKERLSAQCRRVMKAFLKPELQAWLLYVLRTVHQTFRSFIVGQCTEAVILGVLCALGMLLLRLPYAVMTGTIIGVTALIPVAGAYIGGALGAFMIFTADPIKAIIFLIFLVLLQQVEGHFIYPHVVGGSIGLPGLWVLAAVTIGAGVMGIPGMLIGVPICAAVYKLFADQVGRRLRGEKGAPELKES